MWPFNKTKVIPGDYQAMRAEEVFAAQRQIRQLGLDAARYRWLRDENLLVVDASGEDLDKLTDAGIASSVLFSAQTDEEKARVVVLGAPAPRPDWVCSECDQNRLKGPCPRRYTTAADTCPMQGPTS